MCAPFVWLSYVQPSRGKTFAYLRSFALPYEATVLGRRDEPNAEREEGAGKDVPSPGPSSSAKRDLPEKRAVLSWPPATPPAIRRGINRLSGESNLSDGLAFIERPHLTSRLIRHRPTGVLNDGGAPMTLLLPSDPL